MLIEINHPKLGIGKTRLSSDVSASATSSSVDNNVNFASGDYVIFGKTGQEKTEAVLLTGVTGNGTLNHTTGPVFSHSGRTPIYETKYNQVEISSSSTESGTYSVLATTDLTFSELNTVYDDTSGTTSTWYKIRYYDEHGTTYSDYSDPVQGTGYTEESLYSMAQEVLEEFGDENAAEINLTRVYKKLRAGVRKITREIKKVNPDYRKAYTTQTLSTDTATYDLPTRFISFIRVDVNFTGTDHSDAYKASFESEKAGLPDTTYDTSDPRVFIRGDQFGLRPTPTTTGKAWLWYWDYPSHMTDTTDEHGLPYGARELLVTYALYKLWLPKDIEKSLVYKADFKEDLENYVEFTADGRQIMTGKSIEIEFGQDLYS